MKKSFRFTAFIAFTLALVACGSSGGGVIPAAPSNVRATADTGAIVVTWQDMSASETGFTIYREATAGSLSTQAFSQIGKVGANETAYTDSTIELNTSYRYAVAANGSGGNSAQSVYETAVSVANKLPIITYTLDTSIDKAILEASVTDIDGDVQTVVVDWGDAQTETISANFETINLEHTYTAFATYKVTITATDDIGGIETKSEDLEVTAFPSEGLIAEFLTYETWDNRVLPDSSGQGNDAYTNSSGSREVSLAIDRFGLANKAFDFRGTNAGQASILEIRSDPEGTTLDYGDAFSLAIWVGSNSSSRSGFLIGQQGSIPELNSPGLVSNGSAVSLDIPLANEGEGFTLSDPNAIAKGEGNDIAWTFYVLTVERETDNLEFKLYRDGASVAEDSLTGENASILPEDSPIIVGARGSSRDNKASRDFEGFLDDIRIYDRVLRASEIKSLYEEGGWTGNP